MELLEYIKKNYKTPNVAVLRTLGASEELIEYLTNTPWNTNMKIVEGLIGGSDEGNGIKSISISPAITTTPALDSLFPIYWDDLTDEEKEEQTKTIMLTTNRTLVDGTTYTVTVTPTADWYAVDDGDIGRKGEPVTFTATASAGHPFIVSAAALSATDPYVYEQFNVMLLFKDQG